jgi:divalent metal cation (Fe/Co/Zn/Cd) transporter
MMQLFSKVGENIITYPCLCIFEKKALRITGTAFYILAVGLVITAGINLYQGNRPETTFWGIVIAVISILTMWTLIYFKVNVGKKLNSDAILEDANCTKACLYLSFTLLIANVGFELTGVWVIDSIGAILIAIFSFREGRESFEKAWKPPIPRIELKPN